MRGVRRRGDLPASYSVDAYDGADVRATVAAVGCRRADAAVRQGARRKARAVIRARRAGGGGVGRVARAGMRAFGEGLASYRAEISGLPGPVHVPPLVNTPIRPNVITQNPANGQVFLPSPDFRLILHCWSAPQGFPPARSARP